MNTFGSYKTCMSACAYKTRNKNHCTQQHHSILISKMHKNSRNEGCNSEKLVLSKILSKIKQCYREHVQHTDKILRTINNTVQWYRKTAKILGILKIFYKRWAKISEHWTKLQEQEVLFDNSKSEPWCRYWSTPKLNLFSFTINALKFSF